MGLKGEFALELMSAANQYSLIQLKRLCEAFIMQGIEDDIVYDVLQAAELYQANRLKVKCLEYVSCMFRVVDIKDYCT